MVNVSAISPNSLPRLPGVTAAEYRQQQHQHTERRHDLEGRRAKLAHRESGNAGNGLPQTLSVFFFFWGRGVETRCSYCRPPTLCSDKVSRNQRQRSGNRLRRTKAAHGGKPATADNRPPAKLTGAKDQRKPCGALFANVVETAAAAEAPASPHQRRGATAGDTVPPSSADAVRLGGAVAVVVPHGVPGALHQRREHWW